MVIRMNLRHLFIFQTVAKEESFTGAAKKLYMTQPAVSHVIGELEKEVGAPLFDRLSRRIRLNQTGQLFLNKVTRLLELYEDLEQGIYNLEKQAVLRIGSSITIANFWLPAIMKEFACRSDTPVTVEVDSAGNTMEKLRKNEIDLALIEGAAPREPYVSIPFASYRIAAACAPSYRIADLKEISLEQLAGEKLLMREKGSAVRDIWESTLYLHHLSARPVWTSVNSQALICAAAAGLGVTVLPELLLREGIEKRILIEIEVNDVAWTNQNHIVYHRDKYLSGPMKLFIELFCCLPASPTEPPAGNS